MSTTRLRGAVLALAVGSVGSLGCGGSTPGAPATPAPTSPVDPSTPAPPVGPGEEAPRGGDPEGVLRDETTVTTASKATFTAPAGWTLYQEGEFIRLTEPDGEARVWMVEQRGATDGAAAIEAAWKRSQPGFALPIAQSRSLPAADGWQERMQTLYVTRTEESRSAFALARRFGDTWYIALIDGKNGALDRRGAQLGAMLESFRAPKMEQESFAGKAALPLDAARLAAFAGFVEEARLASSVPGAAVAIVRGGKIVFERGFGVRELGKAAKVTPATRFMIGSTTKSLTTVMMARLVDAGKLTWQTPVTQLAPGFALGDEAATRALTLQHTVCACTGMPRRDLEFIFEYEGVSAEARIGSMRSMKPTTGFGETFQYSNLMVAAGGYLAAQAAQAAAAEKGKPGSYDRAYDAAMKAEVFGPLGMKSTTLFTKVALAGEHAMPHARGMSMSYEAIPMKIEGAVEAVRPAGAAWSTVRDLARYAALELGSGTVDGKVVVSKENLLKRRTPQVKISATSSYGLGLFVDSDHGVAVLHHGGNTLGFTSDLFVLPEHDLGVIVLTNAGGANAFRRAVRRRFLELLFEGKATAQEEMMAAHARAKLSLDETLALIKKPADEAWMQKLVGKYHNADLGGLEVRKQGAGYVLDVGEWQSPVTQELDLDKTEKLIMTGAPFGGFDVVPEEREGKMTLVLDSGQVKYVFEPAPLGPKGAKAR